MPTLGHVHLVPLGIPALVTRSVSESGVTVVGNVSRSLLGKRTMTESGIVVTSNTPVGIRVVPRALTEIVIITESLIRKLSAFRVMSDNTVNVTDSLIRTRVVPRSISEAVNIVDSLVRLLRRVRFPTELPTNVTDTIQKGKKNVRTTVESFGVTSNDSIGRQIRRMRILSDNGIAIADRIIAIVGSFVRYAVAYFTI